MNGRFVVVGIALAILSVAPATAYTSQGGPLTEEAPALYVHRNSGDAAYWLSTLAAEPDANDPDPGYNVLGIAGPLGCGDGAQYCWRVSMDPAPAADVELDTSQPTKFHLIYQAIASLPVAGGVGGAPGALGISASLLVAGEVVASVSSDVAPTTGTFETVDLEAPTGLAKIPAGAAVILEVRIDGASGGAVLGADGTHEGNTYVLLPVVGGMVASAEGPTVMYGELTAPTLQHTFSNATSDTYHLNFTTALANSTANFAWNATAGSVNATLTDANGAVVFNQTLEGNGTLAHDILNATAGPWNLTLAYNGFNGTFAFDLAAPTPAGQDNQTAIDDGTPGADPTGGNETEDLDDAAKDTPLPAIIPVVAALAAVAWRRRP